MSTAALIILMNSRRRRGGGSYHSGGGFDASIIVVTVIIVLVIALLGGTVYFFNTPVGEPIETTVTQTEIRRTRIRKRVYKNHVWARVEVNEDQKWFDLDVAEKNNNRKMNSDGIVWVRLNRTGGIAEVRFSAPEPIHLE